MSTAEAWQPTPGAEFGSGGAHPFDHAIRTGGGRLSLVPRTRSGRPATILDVSDYLAPATVDERRALDETAGPLLDVGCGPGRIVHAAIDAGRLALGIDISRAAVARATADGLPILHRSVFDPLPSEGSWGAVTLFDGNIGIDGDPQRLLRRCAALLAPGGRLLVETHPEHDRDHRFEARLVHPAGGRSGWFPWAEAGAVTVAAAVNSLGMATTTVTHGARTFVVATR